MALNDFGIDIKLKKILEDRNITQLKLSDLTGITPSRITSFIRGNSNSINANHLEKIAKALNIYHISDILDIQYDDDKLISVKNDIDKFVNDNIDLFTNRDIHDINKSFRRKRINLNFNLFINQDDFNVYQIKEILLGCLDDSLDISCYADTKYNNEQMKAIREGLEEGIDVNIYAKPEFTSSQMRVIKSGLLAGIDVTEYTDINLSEYEMDKIKRKLIDKKNKRY